MGERHVLQGIKRDLSQTVMPSSNPQNQRSRLGGKKTSSNRSLPRQKEEIEGSIFPNTDYTIKKSKRSIT